MTDEQRQRYVDMHAGLDRLARIFAELDLSYIEDVLASAQCLDHLGKTLHDHGCALPDGDQPEALFLAVRQLYHRMEADTEAQCVRIAAMTIESAEQDAEIQQKQGKIRELQAEIEEYAPAPPKVRPSILH